MDNKGSHHWDEGTAHRMGTVHLIEDQYTEHKKLNKEATQKQAKELDREEEIQMANKYF